MNQHDPETGRSTRTRTTPNGAHPVSTLALRPRDAAKALGIGERLLWSMTNQRLIPHLRIGKAVVYPVAQLEAWLAEQAARGGRPKA